MVFVVLLFSCSINKKGKAVKTAEIYVTENILPLFEGSVIVDQYPGMIVEPIKYIKDVTVQYKHICTKEKYAWETKKWYGKHKLGYDTKENFKKELVKNAIRQSEIQALKNANAHTGFYTVPISIKCSQNEYETFSIIVTKNMKVLNTTINMAKIDSIMDKLHTIELN